jgi:uncharacterized protein YgbK (DUF1537 family)
MGAMIPRLLILADDFTGALDTGVRLAAAGVAVRVIARGRGGLPVLSRRALRGNGPAIVIDTESRHVRPGTAARRVRRWSRAALGAGIPFMYKKTDSTLRGNIGAELSALLRGSGEDRLYFVPALPSAGRTTKKGMARLNGAPWSSVSAIIARQTDIPVQSVPTGTDPPRGGLGKRILVFDAETEEDLHDIGRRIASTETPRATAGCSGFASVLPGLLGLPRSPVPGARLDPPMLVVCGSLQEASLTQVERAEEAGFPSFLLDGAAARVIADALSSRGMAIVKTAIVGSCKRSSRAVSRNTGVLARKIYSMVRPSTLVLFGGDTAYGVASALGIQGMRPVREISQGVVVSRARRAGHGLCLITKAGGFGPPDVLLRIRDELGKEP